MRRADTPDSQKAKLPDKTTREAMVQLTHQYRRSFASGLDESSKTTILNQECWFIQGACRSDRRALFKEIVDARTKKNKHILINKRVSWELGSKQGIMWSEPIRSSIRLLVGLYGKGVDSRDSVELWRELIEIDLKGWTTPARELGRRERLNAQVAATLIPGFSFYLVGLEKYAMEIVAPGLKDALAVELKKNGCLYQEQPVDTLGVSWKILRVS